MADSIEGLKMDMNATTRLRALLERYRKAVAARDEAEKVFDEYQAAYDATEAERKAAGESMLSSEVAAYNAALDAHTKRWHDPVDHVVGLMRSGVCLMHDVDPRGGRLARPLAAVVEGTILVAVDMNDDPRGDGLWVVAPGDVLGMPEDIPHINDPKLWEDLEVEPEPTPKPKRRRKAVKP